MPLAADACVRLVHAPVWTHRLAIAARCIAEQWQEALHPAIDRALVDEDAALRQPFADFGIAQAVADIPANREGDDVVWKRAAGERRDRAAGEAATAVTSAEPLAAELGSPVLCDDF